MAEKSVDLRRFVDPKDPAFVRRLVLAMVVSPLPRSPLARRYPPVLERRRVKR